MKCLQATDLDALKLSALLTHPFECYHDTSSFRG